MSIFGKYKILRTQPLGGGADLVLLEWQTMSGPTYTVEVGTMGPDGHVYFNTVRKTQSYRDALDWWQFSSQHPKRFLN